MLIFATGLLLLLRNLAVWMDPAPLMSSSAGISISLEKAVEAASKVREARIGDLRDIDKIEVLPAEGIVIVRSHNSWEVHLDAHSAEIIRSARKPVDIIKALHDGTAGGSWLSYGLYAPVALLLCFSISTGAWLLLRTRVR